MGSVVTAWAHLAAADFELTRGEPVRFESSPGITRTFCGRCGTSLTYHYAGGNGDGETSRVDVTSATLDDPEAFPPTREGPGRPAWRA